MVRTKKVKSSGRHKVGYGIRVRTRLVDIESKQRKRQICPFCGKKAVKRKAPGIWRCKSCKKVFAADTYFLDHGKMNVKPTEPKKKEKTKPKKEEKKKVKKKSKPKKQTSKKPKK